MEQKIINGIGIYLITNLVNNKVYVGSSTDIKKRWRDHKWYLRNNKHHNSHLQSSYNKYGIESYKFEIIKYCEIDELLDEERYYIKKYKSNINTFGYNVNDPEHKFLGKKHSEKTKKILSKQKMGELNPMYGKKGKLHHNFGKMPTAKLNENDVKKIRELYKSNNLSYLKIGKMYNVSYGCIRKIVKRLTWEHVG